MPSQVILKFRKGNAGEAQKVFTERTVLLVGRYEQCGLPLTHRDVSWIHCLLDINPPFVSVRDCGSRNGTFLNGTLIGKRDLEQSAREGQRRTFPDYAIKNGDLLVLAKGTVEIEIETVAVEVCSDCGAEILQAQQAESLSEPDAYRCADCRAKMRVHLSVPAHGQEDEDSSAAFLRNLFDQLRQDDPGLASVRDCEIVRRFPLGGFGVVYLARRRSTGEYVAIKLMRPEIAKDQKARLLFERECANIRALNHPHVVRFHDSGKFQGNYYFVMEYCAGGSVQDLMNRRRRPLDLEEALHLIFQALDGLEYAHHAPIPNVPCGDGEFRAGYGLVHRDIKPGNLFLTGSEARPTLKIGDYGLAKSMDLAGLTGVTVSGSHLGTPHYMPRQQVADYRFVGPEVDVWATMASFYYMLTQQTPKAFEAGMEPWGVAFTTEARPIRTFRPDIPGRMADLIDRALRDTPTIPFASPATLKAELERVR